MVNRICLDSVIPKIFVGAPAEGAPSEVWGRKVEFCRGESYLIEADSGRGKTSLCAFIYGMRQDYEGRILFDGKPMDMRRLHVLRQQQLALMFQELRLFGELTAVENIQLKNQLTNHLALVQIKDMLARLGLADKLDTQCRYLSLGQQQRVAFVRMLAQPADFLVLDEPVSHLDDGNAAVMSEMLRERQQQDGCGIIASSIGRQLPYEYDHVLAL